MKDKIWNRTTRRVAVILGALLVTLVVILLSNSYVQKNTNLVKVVVAAEDIQPYQNITNIQYIDKVRGEVPDDAITDMNELKNQSWVAGEIGFYKGEAIRKSGITTGENSPYGKIMNLEEGSSLVGVKVDQAQSAGDYIKPGVVVDAIVYVRNEFETKVIGPKDDPDLGGLFIFDRQNSEGTEPGSDGRSLIPSVAIIKTKSEEVKKKLVEYQEEGKIYLSPSGIGE